MKIPNLHNPPNPTFNTLFQPSSVLMTSLAAISLEQPLVRVMNSVDKYDGHRCTACTVTSIEE